MQNELGMIAWFAVHCTSMNNTNELISGDNKGYASYYVEQIKNNRTLPGKVTFLAAFGQRYVFEEATNLADPWVGRWKPRTDDRVGGGRMCCSNEGDVSPNTLGPMCPDGTSCDNPTSTCGGKIKTCNARGPGYPSDFKSTQIIGAQQVLLPGVVVMVSLREFRTHARRGGMGHVGW